MAPQLQVPDGRHCAVRMGHDALANTILLHIHSMKPLTENDKQWYLTRKWTVSRFCQKDGKHTPTRDSPHEWEELGTYDG